ncbi:MAG: hypothetical protein H0X25_19340 [Acidobacteriales bacterium]|nr:hypothetical protein [Terriglobales bacterium]
MSTTGVQAGINGAAVIRAAEAMMRTLGGAQITLLFPLNQMPSDASAQLGLVDPGVEQVVLEHVVVRNLATANHGPRRRMEFLVAATEIGAELSSRNMASAESFFEQTLGIVYDGETLHVEGMTTEYFAGTAYLYRITAVE